MSTTSTRATLPTEAEVVQWRRDFPLLATEVNGHPVAYLDSGATSQKPAAVLDAERGYYERLNAAVHRGAHTLAAEATVLFEDARASVAGFVGAAEEEVVWTSNATEALNLVAYAFSNASVGRGGEAAQRFRLTPGDEVVVTEQEHHANLIPWQELAARTGATLKYIPVTDDGALDLEAAGTVITDRTRLLAFTHVSNVLGVVNPVQELVSRAHDVGALVVLDACQSVPHLPVDFPALDVDFAVTMEAAEYLPPPQRFEAGTQKVSQAVAWAAAVDYLQQIGMDRIAAHEAELGHRLITGLREIPGIRVLGGDIGAERVGLASFDVAGVHAHDVGQFLDDRGIAVRVGHHCAQPLHRRFGVTASTRASTYLYTTEDEVTRFLEGVAGVGEFFGVRA
jgi:cysteine desulfurase / selenocysteine lyase